MSETALDPGEGNTTRLTKEKREKRNTQKGFSHFDLLILSTATVDSNPLQEESHPPPRSLRLAGPLEKAADICHEKKKSELKRLDAV
jgi:hypothetical protein